MKFEYGTQTIEFDVKYSDRKTIEIGVEAPAVVKVVAPKGLADDMILDNVRKKAKWIVTKLFEIREVQYLRAPKEYVNGEAFLYLGRNYSLQLELVESIKKPLAKLYQGKFIITTSTKDQDILKNAMEKWYRIKTLDKVLDKVTYFQKYFDIEPKDIKVKEQKKRWASCTAKRELMFNWRCSMAPSWVFDYIVVHEMCHMVYMNHSKEFWDLLERIMPDYEKKRDWLKVHGVKLEL
ncbi:M48 family metallopeptidase [Vallitalea sediminicola]